MADESEEDDQSGCTPTPPRVSSLVQYVVTFGIGGIGVYWLWPHLDGISRGMVGLFGILAAMSIQNGTWLEDSRGLRRQARDDRREAYGHVRQMMKPKSS